MTKTELRNRMKKACIDAGITRFDFINRYYGSIIPISKGGVLGKYRHVSNILSKYNSQKIPQWLIDAVCELEKEDRWTEE